jgi:hypothetical protein
MARAVWEAIDGKLFATQAEALAYEAQITRVQALVRWMQIIDCTPTLRETIAQTIINHRVAVSNILK